ncbi:hypothetical protein GCM10009759_25310 [Kitasatospora saccharophila]|uniref:Excreted virulence factor EspC (Type VII ESX diderm) n=1 Tax=Kitasatospora saccharophila TaxID=407973 RepID=A0ABP5IC55_9ACTN
MADPTSTGKTSTLKAAFAEFDVLKDIVTGVNDDLTLINTLNLHVGGDDEIGKQYHQQVDEGTRILTELITRIRTTMGQYYEGGTAFADTLDRADDDGAHLMNSKL